MTDQSTHHQPARSRMARGSSAPVAALAVALALLGAACGGGAGSPVRASARTTTTMAAPGTSTTAARLSAGPYGAPAPTVPSAVTVPSAGSSPVITVAPTTTSAARPATTSTTRAPATTTTASSTTSTTAPRSTTTTVSSTTTTTGPAGSASDTSGGLTVTLTVQPVRAPAGTRVHITVQADEAHAPGALAYQLAYGDGGAAQNTTSTACKSGQSGPQQQTWSFDHSYAAKGSFFVRVTVVANCTPDQASASVTATAQ